MDLIVNPVGLVRCVYDEGIDVHALGLPRIVRASRVEPDEHGRWHADLTAISGPVLGPFDRRGAALEAERAWLVANWLVSPAWPIPTDRAARAGPGAESPSPTASPAPATGSTAGPDDRMPSSERTSRQ
jgi:hypothetical protein